MVVILHISVIKLISEKMPHELMPKNKPWRIFETGPINSVEQYTFF